MSGGARREAVDKALEAEHKQHNAEYVESSGRYDAYAQRAGTAQDLTQASEARTEAARLTTGAGSAARQVRDNAQKRQKTQENTVERARVQSREGRAVDHDAKNSGEDLKAAENDSEIRRLATPQGRQATQNRKNTEGLLQGTEADVERDRLTTPAGQRSYEFQKNFEGRLETQQHDSETLRLGTTAGEAVESAKEDAAGNLKVAQNEVKTLRLQNSASQAIEHSVHRAEDNLKAAELGVKTSGLQTLAGQASAGALKAAELDANLSRAAIENPVETAHVIANRDDYANVKQSSLSTSMERSIAENQGELQHLADERTDLYVRQAESQGQLEHSKASQDRLISDLKTEEGIRKHAGTGPNQVDVQVADNIRTAALGKRVQSMAQQNAELQHGAESAQQILANPTIADEAGGVAAHGATMAQAQAKRAVADDFNKTVAAMKTLHSQTDSSVLREKFDTIDKLETLSTEEVASDAGLIASRNHVEEQIKLQAQLQKLGQQIQLMPNSSRKTTLQDKLKTIVQQVSDDRKIKVAGLSTKELGANQVGEVAADGKNIFQASRDRILSHMTVERMATTPFGDPDQLAMYYEMARANKLSTDELNKIGETYASWKVSKQHRDSLSDNQRQLFDAILTRTPPPGYKTKYADGIATLT